MNTLDPCMPSIAHRFLLICTAVVLFAPVLRADTRVWTSASGATVEAELVEHMGDDVHLRAPDGRAFSIRHDQLSSADQRYLADLSAAPSEPRAAASPAPGREGFDLRKITGPELVDARRRPVSSEVLDGKVVGIYFSAHWCGPCRRFTPVLVDAYKEMHKKGLPFEVLLVSSDESERDMYRYMRDDKMPWPAIPHGSDAAQALVRQFRASGIPRLVIVDADGSTLHQSARGQVVEEGARAWDRWMETRRHRAER